MSQTYPKRLIEVDLPIARISAHARREKSIRHGHISTLHIWWARRPLAACRAVICASLWPDPADELCPPAFREAAAEQITAFANRVFPKKITEEGRLLSSEKHLPQESRGRWEAIAQGTLTLDPSEESDWFMLRMCLLDFIADFANWNNSTVSAYLETSRALTQAAHEALGGVPGTRPLVVDPFAGGGSIPLEALRIGGDAFASDLNPIAVLLNKVVLEYIPKYGRRLADEVHKWGQWVKEQAEQELAEFYPQDPDGAIPIAYIWARTVLSEAPGETIPVEVPLVRSFWLCKKPKQKVALRWKRDTSGNVATITQTIHYTDGSERLVMRPELEVFQPKSDRELDPGTVARGSATCPVTGFTTPLDSVKTQLRSRRGGAWDARLLCVVTTPAEKQGRNFRLPTEEEAAVAAKAEKKLNEWIEQWGEASVPNESTEEYHTFVNRGPLYGMRRWTDYFSQRQLLALLTLARTITNLRHTIPMDSEEGFVDAIQTCLALALDRQADSNSSLCSWRATSLDIGHTFGRQALPMLWDFVEGNIFSGATRDWGNAVEGGLKALRSLDAGILPGMAERASASSHPLPNDGVQCFATDPPYYYSVQYADLSDFFYVWLKRTLRDVHPSLFTDALAPKDDEIIVQSPGHQFAESGKNNAFYESRMMQALSEGRRIVAPSGIGIVVFAHTSTAGWESLLQALIDAGWVVTGSWPIDTEMATRVIAQGRSVLASSVHLICRPREEPDGSLREEVGEWRDVLSELPKRIHEWMPRLAAEGVVGADAIFACLGPALEIFSRYSRVEKASGEAVPLREYLEQVWATVSTEALSMIFKDADAACLEPDARLTAMWLWTLGGMETNGSDSKSSSDSDEKVVASKGYTLEYDAARKIAQGLGVHLEQSDSIVEVSGDKARLLPVGERTRHLFGKDEATTTPRGKKKKAKAKQLDLFKTLDEIEAEAEETIAGELNPQAGETVLDRVHQSMILFASGRGEALRRFLVDDGAGNDARFWKLAQSLSALYPKETDEKRWVDGVLARKKGLGL